MRTSGRSEEARRFLAGPVQYFDAGRVRLSYRRFGEGPPLLLIHGWPLWGFTWRRLIPELARHYTCYAVDLAGAGDTDWAEDNDFSFHGHADNLQRLARGLQLDGYRIVSHDTGATVARQLAVSEGSRVLQLVCIDTEIPHHRPPLVPQMQLLFQLPGTVTAFQLLLRSETFVRSPAGFGGCFADRRLIDQEFIEGFVRPLVDSRRRLDGQVRYALGIDWAQLDGLAEGHRRIAAEVLLIWGDRDPFFPIEQARQMIPQFARCRGLVTIPGARLFPHEEFPDQVNRHILEFFGVSAGGKL